jgi:hypothetical protein
MPERQPHHQRTWGFRLSVVDVVFLALATPATWWAWPQIGAMAGVIPLVVGHFFLFCNVFRIHRTKELLWAGVCLLNVVTWGVTDDVWWPGILLIQLPLTVVLIWSETRHPRYHGIFARRLNPRLDDYLKGIL